MGRQLVAKCIHPTDVYDGGQEGTRRAVQLGSEESVAGTKNYLAGSIFAASESGPFAYCKGIGEEPSAHQQRRGRHHDLGVGPR